MLREEFLDEQPEIVVIHENKPNQKNNKIMDVADEMDEPPLNVISNHQLFPMGHRTSFGMLFNQQSPDFNRESMQNYQEIEVTPMQAFPERCSGEFEAGPESESLCSEKNIATGSLESINKEIEGQTPLQMEDIMSERSDECVRIQD
jgi:hypothetical protein